MPTTLKTLAGDIRMDRSHLRKLCIRLGIDMQKIRDPDGGGRGQAMLAVSDLDAQRIRAHRADYRPGKVQADGAGMFYAIRPNPTLAPCRVKVGFSRSLDARLATYRTICPRAELIGSWPCRPSFEAAAIAAVSRGSVMLSTEILETKPEDVLTRATEFFRLVS